MTKEFFERGKQIAKWADNNMTKDKALQMAINALTNCSRFEEAIQACKEALEQPSWRGLSPEEKMMIKIFTGFGDYEQLICAIEQELKEKNT